MLQPPQLFGSEVMSVQPEAHAIWPNGHWQVPPWSTSPVGHTHMPPCRLAPVGHWHVPPLHVPSPSHVAPSLPGGFEHVPVFGSQVPLAWQASDAMHTTGLPPTHVPLMHASFCVHAFPSLHDVPSGAFGFEHTPVTELQVPAT
jgi:hypothetical protein